MKNPIYPSAIESESAIPEPALLRRRFLEVMRMRNCSETTIHVWSGSVRRFWTWCDQRGLVSVTELTKEVLDAFRRHLFHRRQPKTDKPLRFSTQISYLVPVRRWCEWLFEEGWIENDVTEGFELPKEEKRLPINTLSVEQVERILNATDTTTSRGVRDRAIIETFYSTGVRCTELTNLAVYDVDIARHTVIVRMGKGKKDRVVPIGKRALLWVCKYLEDVRPSLVRESNENRLFVSRNGQALTRNCASAIVKGYFRKAGIRQRGSCHLLRHTAATLMMDNGADIRSLQQFLGHSRLNTTMIYTHVSIRRLKAVHGRTHPADLPYRDPDEGSCPSMPE